MTTDLGETTYLSRLNLRDDAYENIVIDTAKELVPPSDDALWDNSALRRGLISTTLQANRQLGATLKVQSEDLFAALDDADDLQAEAMGFNRGYAQAMADLAELLGGEELLKNEFRVIDQHMYAGESAMAGETTPLQVPTTLDDSNVDVMKGGDSCA